MNIDTSRHFGEDILRIPGVMKRTSIIIIIVIGSLMTIIMFMPWILEAIETVLGIIFRFLYNLPDYLLADIDVPPPSAPAVQDDFPFFIDDEPVSESRPIPMVIIWILIGASALAMIGAIIFALIKIVIFIMSLFKTRSFKSITDSEVFTETIEKISPTRVKRSVRNLIRRPRYSSLLTERERILFIYNEYVKRAKKKGLTSDYANNTATEVLDEITLNAIINENIGKSSGKSTGTSKSATTGAGNYTLPENLAEAFNKAKDSNIDTELSGADALKQRLL